MYISTPNRFRTRPFSQSSTEFCGLLGKGERTGKTGGCSEHFFASDNDREKLQNRVIPTEIGMAPNIGQIEKTMTPILFLDHPIQVSRELKPISI